jgi:hypothetical protein
VQSISASIEGEFAGKRCKIASFPSTDMKFAPVLVRVDHVASRIVNADHGVM